MTISSLTSANVSATYAAAANAAKATVTNVAAAAPKASASAVTVSISSAGRAAAAAVDTPTPPAAVDISVFLDAVTKAGGADKLTGTYALTIKASELKANLGDLVKAAGKASIASIKLTDSPAPTIELDQSVSTQKLSNVSALLAKVTTAHTLVLANALASEVTSLKAVTVLEKLNFKVNDTGNLNKDTLTALQLAAKAKTLTQVTLKDKLLTLSSADFTKTYADLVKVIEKTGSINLTGVSIKDFTTTFKDSIGADKSIGSVTISDVAANVVLGTNAAALKTAVTAKTVTAVSINDTATNIIKAGAAKVLAAKSTIDSGIKDFKTTVSFIAETKPVTASISDADALMTLGNDLKNVALSDSAMNIVARARLEAADSSLNLTSNKVLSGKITVTDKAISMTVADAQTLLPNIDATKVKWSISDSAANIAAAFAAKSDTVTKATSLAFTTSMTIDSAKTILAGAKTKLPTAGALAISDSVKNIVDASKSSDAATNLTALIAKGFSINISDSAANIAGSDGAFADIDSLIGKIADIKLDDGNSKTDNDAVFAYGTKLADHANTIGHIVDSYSVAKDTSSSGEGP